MNRRAFLVALACVPAAVVAKTKVSHCMTREGLVGRAWDMGKGTSIGGEMIVWRKGPTDEYRAMQRLGIKTVISFPPDAKLPRVASLDGDLRVYCMVGDSGYELKRGEDGVFR